ncbi:hypothetical protein G6Z84_03060 [Lactobacillus iners]|jgi:hypothetical protein|uniref:hypothetical protein n=1 Tax=Lactobacillus iners TaxID=147802 RepID=UPI0001E9C06B|nr:hypothetical protein [Lactobacillus iners]EFQ50479.1 hypothetical protein HMPREF9218_0113 [Lactobacillus iners LEAF 2062A-h1]MCT7822886.1 hypothetical protein [Lactobacillus crispatus]QIH25018.1 hypothetical protein G6Z84_03060 [Lactobacillus iners]DAK92867.1 MAG TPA: tail completion protein [Caudoviricetes sp.]
MIESLLVRYLLSKGVQVALERRQGIDVIIDKTSSHLENFQFSHTFVIQVYGESKAIAAEKSYKILAYMLDLPNQEKRIADVKLNSGPYDFSQIGTKEYRYQTYYEVYEY